MLGDIFIALFLRSSQIMIIFLDSKTTFAINSARTLNLKISAGSEILVLYADFFLKKTHTKSSAIIFSFKTFLSQRTVFAIFLSRAINFLAFMLTDTRKF